MDAKRWGRGQTSTEKPRSKPESRPSSAPFDNGGFFVKGGGPHLQRRENLRRGQLPLPPPTSGVPFPGMLF